METVIKHLIEQPRPLVIFIAIILITGWLIVNFEKIIKIFSSSSKNIDRLEDTKKRISKGDKLLKAFVNSQIQVHNFKKATKLPKNRQNQELLNQYMRLKDEISWFEFKMIKDEIQNPKNIKPIVNNVFKLKYNRRQAFYTVIIVIAIILIFWVNLKYHLRDDKMLVLNLFMYASFGFTYFLFLRKRNKYRIAKKYDTAIKGLVN